jgi:hypothetical protein
VSIGRNGTAGNGPRFAGLSGVTVKLAAFKLGSTGSDGVFGTMFLAALATGLEAAPSSPLRRLNAAATLA